ncbi:MAG: malto-oligosyltrehalose synthase [Burkholderiales bacterium]
MPEARHADAYSAEHSNGLMPERARPDAETRRRLSAPARATRIPRATYRLQLHGGFRLRDALAIIPYLAELGISHVYCSPYLRARPGSPHGYDIVDHQTLNPEIGSAEDLKAFVAALRAHGMAQMIDIVPNHMGVLGADNAWWLDVLENGHASVYADYFDIDWHPGNPDLTNRVLVPVLGDHYGFVLERGEITLGFDAATGSFSIHYYDSRFPIDPSEYPRILAHVLGAASIAGIPDAALGELKTLATAFGALSPRDATVPEEKLARHHAKEHCKRRLADLVVAHNEMSVAIEAAMRSLNGVAGEPASFDLLHQLLEAQAYRLAFWRVAADEINYRRFFDINELAALRVEDEAVFQATHKLVFELVAAGQVDALRIDHPDGLFDPAAYFRRLRETTTALAQQRPDPADHEPLYVSVEKIIAPFEAMPDTWAVDGTTGYRFANLVNGLFVDTEAQASFTRLYHSFTAQQASYQEVTAQCKRLVLQGALASELTTLSSRLARIARADRYTRDYTSNSLRQALTEVIVAFPVYRTYVANGVSAEDRRYIEWAVERARRHIPSADNSIFDFIKSALLAEAAAPDAAQVRYFARKFQQVTAPVMAKGVEDTSFYVYNRLVSLNDVGGDPSTFGYSVNAFHGASADRAAKWPHTMLATSTHDNKRSEDVRMRIDVLSELPAAWRLKLRRWSRLNRSKKRKVADQLAPARNDEYLLYQTLIGSFPMEDEAGVLTDYCARIERYMLKAVREAKTHTSWVNHNEEYERAVTQFVRALLSDTGRNLFLQDFREAVRPLIWFGMLNSLSMVLVKLTSPGVPDCYQGNEIWDFSLVDPDNRRPVDYTLRRQLLAEIESHEDVFSHMHDGRAKLYFMSRLLALRARASELFMYGSYTALQVQGERAAHVVAYVRRHENACVIAIAGRLFATLGVKENQLPCAEPIWQDTRVELPFLDEGCVLRNVLDDRVHRLEGGAVRMADLFRSVPGAVLVHGVA